MQKPKVILFDLDDTLLGNKMDVFLQAYFPLFAEYVNHVIDGSLFLSELMYATQEMIANTDQSMTNREVFWSIFSQRTDLDQDKFEPYTKNFYLERFGELESYTSRRPSAERLMSYLFTKELPVVIATNPLFPQEAIEQRLDWAGVSTRFFQYALVTSYEIMHSAKPHPEFYREILDTVGFQAENALMVGDDWENDIVPAKSLGMQTYWICDPVENPPGIDADASGSLHDLYQAIHHNW